jgi:hypothetical protein
VIIFNFRPSNVRPSNDNYKMKHVDICLLLPSFDDRNKENSKGDKLAPCVMPKLDVNVYIILLHSVIYGNYFSHTKYLLVTNC